MAFVEVLVNEQVRPEQLFVKLAVGVGAGAGGGEPAAPMNSVYSSWFGVPAGTPVTALAVALAVSAVATAAGVAVELAARYNAAAPATWGVAIDVPLIVFVAVLDVFHDDVMLTPGPMMSTQLPKFENDAKASLLADA